MSSTTEMLDQAAIMRQASWNTEFLLADGQAFAGLYIAPNNDIFSKAPELTFQMALDWLLASFDLEMANKDPEGPFADKWLWGFMPADRNMNQPNRRQEYSFPGVYGVTEDWSMDVHMKTGRYYVVRHNKACQEDLDCYGTFENIMAHPFNKCSIHVTQATPKMPRDFRPFKPLTPIRSPHPQEPHTWENFAQDFSGPLAQGVTNSDAQASMAKFHDDFSRGPQHQVCAISGLSTDGSNGSGSRLHIEHIIPADHYDVYPITGVQESEVEMGGMDDYEDSDKWDMTWDREFNGIALFDCFRSLWRSRFVAIEPDTMTIVVLAPYDILIPYHGKKAHFPDGKTPDKEALRWHYRMCLLEALNANSANLKFQKDLKAAAAAAVSDIVAGHVPMLPEYISPSNTPPQEHAVVVRRPGSKSPHARTQGSPPSPNANRVRGASPKRKHDTLSLREPGMHGDREHPDKIAKVLEINEVTIENFERRMATISEFTKKMPSPGRSGRSSPFVGLRGSASP